MKKGTLNPENFISPVQVPLVEHIIEFCALKLHFDFCPINARKPLKYQGFSGFVLFSRTVMASLRGFEPRTFRLGDAPGTPFGLKNRGKKSLEIIDIKGFESF